MAECGSADKALWWKAFECLSRSAIQPDDDQPAAETACSKPSAGGMGGHRKQRRRLDPRREQSSRLLAGKQRHCPDCPIGRERDESASVGPEQHRLGWGGRTDHTSTRHRERPERRFGPVRGDQPLPGRVEVRAPELVASPFCSTSGAIPGAAERSKSRMVGWPSSAENADNHRTVSSKSSPTTPGTVARTGGGTFRAPPGGPHPYRAARVGGRDLAGVTREPDRRHVRGLLEDPAGRAVQLANARKYTARPCRVCQSVWGHRAETTPLDEPQCEWAPRREAASHGELLQLKQGDGEK